MVDHEKPSPEADRWWWLRRWKANRAQPSETARHYYHVLLATVMFFLAQIIICAWDQPFWAYGLDFPGQIVAMVFVWLAMWAGQAALFKPSQGLERFYSQHLRAPVSLVAIGGEGGGSVAILLTLDSFPLRPRFSTSTCLLGLRYPS